MYLFPLAADGTVLIILYSDGFLSLRLIHDGVIVENLRFVVDIVINHCDKTGVAVTVILGVEGLAGIIERFTFGTVYLLSIDRFIPSVVVYRDIVAYL